MVGQALLCELRAKVRAIEGGGVAAEREVARLGPGLDAGLPWGGLPSGCLHEVSGPAASVVVAAFARRAIGSRGVLVWCLSERGVHERGALYGPGLRAFGLDPARLLIARARDDREVLWAFAEALACQGVACAVAELDWLDLLESRLLQLAAEAGEAVGIVLRHGGTADLRPNAALTRWRVSPASRFEPAGRLLLHLDLWRAKGAAPGSWTVAWDERTLAFALVPGMADRADGAQRAAAG
jgi:protein ImuA